MEWEKTRNRVSIAAISIACIVAMGVVMLRIVGITEIEKKEHNGFDKSNVYVQKLFDDSYVHEIDIRIPNVNWDYMVDHAMEEQYVNCSAIIDGERIENVAIRPKGNSSLAAMKSVSSDHFSFKLEFDQYEKNASYYGLDKLVLNNLGQDVSCMKDFLAYHMMNEIGVAAPLSSYVLLKLNGEDFGLYLAVEGIENAFCNRNFGDEKGNIYKPECFAIEKVTPKTFIRAGEDNPFQLDYSRLGPGERVDLLGTFVKKPFEECFGEDMEVAALKYVGDDEKKYQVMFNASVFPVTKADKLSYIKAVKQLNCGENPLMSIDVDESLRYFIVHNFLNNYDGYTGVFVHNYYLRENQGKLSMIPWDYNLAFGIFNFETVARSFLGKDAAYQVTFEVGEAMDDATNMINYPIDTPTITVSLEERPLLAKLLENEDTFEQYHYLFKNFLDEYFASGKFEKQYQNTLEMILPFVGRGQNFYEMEQVQKGAQAVHDYCILREKSIQKQLKGMLPATMQGQREDYENLVDASMVNLADSVMFDSLVFGIRGEDIIAILDAIAGDYTKDSSGIALTMKDIEAKRLSVATLILRVIKESTLIRKVIKSSLEGPVLFIISIIVLCVATKQVKKYKRRK